MGLRPLFLRPDDAEIELERNMTIAYHALFHVEGEAGGVAVENTFRITQPDARY